MTIDMGQHLVNRWWKPNINIILNNSNRVFVRFNNRQWVISGGIFNKENIEIFKKLLLLKNGKNICLKNLITFVIKKNEAKVASNQGK